MSTQVLQILFIILLILMSLFLILVVLVQRGRGGGLAGAFGGLGGQSAFGTKAGDMFTKITMWTAFFWIVLCIISVLVLGKNESALEERGLGGGAKSPAAGAGATELPGETPAGGETALPEDLGPATPPTDQPDASPPGEATPGAASGSPGSEAPSSEPGNEP